MAVDEHRRHALYTRLQQVLGEEHAVALMDHLPPIGSGDMATRQDLDGAEARLSVRVADVKAELLDRMASQTRTFVVAMIGSVATFAGVVLAALP